MNEFGHFSAIGAGFCIDAWGAGPFWIRVGKKTWRFEDSDRFGPTLVDRYGETLDWPSERSPFWRAHRIWVRQGRRVSEDQMTCMWHEPTPSKVWRATPRNIFLIESGEPDGLTIDASEEEVDAWRQKRQKP